MKKDFHACAPHFCVAYQAPHAGRWRRNPCGRLRRNPSCHRRRNPCGHLRPARACMRCGRRPSSSTLRARPSANGSARSARKAVRKNYKVSTRFPATLLLSPRVLNCPFSLPALDATTNLPSLAELEKDLFDKDNEDCGDDEEDEKEEEIEEERDVA
jgi:hypothetical protein